MPRVIHFEIHADNPQRAILFYAEVFGWKFTKWQGQMDYWVIQTMPSNRPGINGGLTKREFPGQPINVGIAVPSVGDYLARIEARGGKTVVGATELPDKTRFAVCQDSEGNALVIVETKEEKPYSSE